MNIFVNKSEKQTCMRMHIYRTYLTYMYVHNDLYRLLFVIVISINILQQITSILIMPSTETRQFKNIKLELYCRHLS